MEESMSKFILATLCTYKESHAVLSICEWNLTEALSLFSLYPREVWGALPKELIPVLGRHPFEVRKYFLEVFIDFFPRDVFKALSQELDEESGDYLAIISIRIFVNSISNCIQRKEFAATLQLGKMELLPIFQKWAQELKEMAETSAEGLMWGATRERLRQMLNQTLPSAEKSNAAFGGIMEDIINLCVPLSYIEAKPALHVVASTGDLDLLTSLLACNAKLDAEDIYKSTALHAGVNYPSIVKALLAAAEHAQQLTQIVEHVNYKNQTALHFCSNVESARLLLRIIPGLVLVRDCEMFTALHSNRDNSSMVELLLAEIEDEQELKEFVEQVNWKGVTALHFCKSAESARTLLRISPRLVFAKDRKGNTALHLRADTPDVVKVLLAAVENEQELKDFVQQVNDEGQTALHLGKSEESAHLLLRITSAMVLVRDRENNTALHFNMDYPSVVKLILAAIEDEEELKGFIQQANNKNETALHLCRNAESARLLLHLSPCLMFAKDRKGNAALHSQVNDSNLVQVLLEAAEQVKRVEEIVLQVNDNRKTALFACSNAESARLLVSVCPGIVFVKDDAGHSALHACVDHPRVVEVLLSTIQDAELLERFVRGCSGYGRTALHFCDNAESARMLLRIAPDLLHVKDDGLCTALHMGVNTPDVVQIYLAAIDDSNKRRRFMQGEDEFGKTALHRCSNAESMRLMLRASVPSLLFFKDWRDQCALIWQGKCPAIIQVYLDVARETGQLVQFVEQVDGMGQTALHFCQNLDSARLMLEVLPNFAFVKCTMGNVPMHIHAMNGLKDMCRWELEECRVDVNAANVYGQTALHFACISRADEVVYLLLKHSPNLLARDADQRTVLHYALMKEWKDNACKYLYLSRSICPYDTGRTLFVVELLLKQDQAIVAELIAARDVFGRTALHYFHEYDGNVLDLANRLILAGANATVQDDQGDTMTHILRHEGRYSLMLHLIMRWGLSIHIKNRDGKTALDLVRDGKRKKELQRASVLAGIVTLRFAARSQAVPSPWKRLPCELFRELCFFLV